MVLEIDASGNKEKSLNYSLSLAIVSPKFYTVFFCLYNCYKQSYVIRFWRTRRKRNISAVSAFFSQLFCGFLFLLFNAYTYFSVGKRLSGAGTFLLCIFPAKSRLHATVKSKELLLKKYKISNSDNKQMCKCLMLCIVTCYSRN